jgi:hypothetical protein
VSCTFCIKIEVEFETYNRPTKTSQLSTLSQQEDNLTHLIYNLKSSQKSIIEHRRRQSPTQRRLSPPLEPFMSVGGSRRRSHSTQHVHQPVAGAHCDQLLQAYARRQRPPRPTLSSYVGGETRSISTTAPLPRASTTTNSAPTTPPQTTTEAHCDQPLAPSTTVIAKCQVSYLHREIDVVMHTRTLLLEGRCLHAQHRAPPW